MTRSLDDQLEEYRGRRFLAMTLAGAIMWTIIGIAGALLDPVYAVWILFIGTGSIVYLEPVYDLWPRLHLQQFLFKSRRFLSSMQRIGRKKERRYGQKGRTMHLGNRS